MDRFSLFIAKAPIELEASAFLTAFCEYDESFATLLNKNRKDMAFNSIHALTTQFEPQLYSKNPRALEGAYYVLEKVLKAGEIIGAKNYTFHGYARIKRAPLTINYDECAFFTQAISSSACALDLPSAKIRSNGSVPEKRQFGPQDTGFEE